MKSAPKTTIRQLQPGLFRVTSKETRAVLSGKLIKSPSGKIQHVLKPTKSNRPSS